MSLVDITAAASFAAGGAFIATSILAALSLTYPAFPLLLGVLVFRERPTVRQWIAVGVLMGGVIALALATP